MAVKISKGGIEIPVAKKKGRGVEVNSKISKATGWSSDKIVETFCPEFEVQGNAVTCYPVENSRLVVTTNSQAPVIVTLKNNVVETTYNFPPVGTKKLAALSGENILEASSGTLTVSGREDLIHAISRISQTVSANEQSLNVLGGM